MDRAGDAVRRMLHAETGDLPLLDKLDDAAAEQLYAHLEEAKKAHDEHIRLSMREALDHFPRMMHGTLRKMFGQ